MERTPATMDWEGTVAKMTPGQRVLIFVAESFPEREPRVRRQAKTLGRFGQRAAVVHTGPERVRRVERGVVAIGVGSGKDRSAGAGGRFADYIRYTRRALARARHYRARWRPGVVQVATPPDWLIVLGLVSRFRKTSRVILDIHDPMPELIETVGLPRFFRMAARWVEKWAARMADRVLVPTDPMVTLLEKRTGCSRPVLVPNAADGDLFFPSREEPAYREHVTLGYHGTVASRFGLGTVLEALAIAREKRSWSGRLVVIGDGPERDALEERAARLGLEGHVEFVGGVPQAEVAKRIRETVDIGVVPYHDSSFMRLAYSTKAYEYLATGIPCVVSDLPGLKQQLGSLVRYAQAGSASDWCDALVEVSTESNWRRYREAALRGRQECLWETWEGGYLRALLD